MITLSATDGRARGSRIYHVAPDDPLGAAIRVELAIEYSARYGSTAGAIHRRMRDRPATEFASPDGCLVVLVENGEPAAAGGFRRFDPVTAELKRVWTARDRRRRGLATRVLRELEAEMIRLGYGRAYGKTGDRQPEARGLYGALGYTEVNGVSGRLGRSRFEKTLEAAPLLESKRTHIPTGLGRRVRVAR